MRNYWYSLCLLIGLVFSMPGSSIAVEPMLTPVDRDLPDFSLQGVDGTHYHTENMKGKTWLINFWAVWCAPCLEELPSLNKTWAQLKDENVGMLGINIGEDANKIEQFLNEHNLQIDFPIVIGDKIRTLGNWSGSGLPFTVIVNPAGKVVYEAVGAREWHEPQFVDAVLALNETLSSQTSGDQSASLFLRVQDMSTPVKAASIFVVLAALIALTMSIRSLLRRKSTSKV